LKITQKNKSEIVVSDFEDESLFNQIISEIETSYAFWKYMRGLDDKRKDYS
jgi:hypothetical protein